MSRKPRNKNTFGRRLDKAFKAFDGPGTVTHEKCVSALEHFAAHGDVRYLQEIFHALRGKRLFAFCKWLHWYTPIRVKDGKMQKDYSNSLWDDEGKKKYLLMAAKHVPFTMFVPKTKPPTSRVEVLEMAYERSKRKFQRAQSNNRWIIRRYSGGLRVDPEKVAEAQRTLDQNEENWVKAEAQFKKMLVTEGGGNLQHLDPL